MVESKLLEDDVLSMRSGLLNKWYNMTRSSSLRPGCFCELGTFIFSFSDTLIHGILLKGSCCQYY